MTIKMGGMFIVAIGILLAGMRYLLTPWPFGENRRAGFK